MEEETWAEQRRRRMRKRQLQIGIGAVACIALAFAVTSYHPRDAVDEVAVAPGFRDDRGSVDTRPFSPAEAHSDGPTTIPDGVLPNPNASTTAPSTSTTIPLPSGPASTIPLVTLPAEADYPRGDKVCAAVAQVYGFVRASNQLTRAGTVAESGATAFRAAAALLMQTADSRYNPAIALFNRAADEMSMTDDPDRVTVIVTPLLNQTTQEARDASAPLTQHVTATCPGLIQTHPG